MEMIPGYSNEWRAGAAGRRRVWLTIAFMLAAFALVGCTGQMPAPPGLTAAPHSTVSYNASAPFSVGLIPTHSPPVRIGDQLGFRFTASQNGYGSLYLLNASGAVVVLARNLPLAADTETVFPGVGDGFILRASPPAGVERALLLVTRQPFAGLGAGSGPDTPVQLPVRAQDFIEALNAATTQLPDQDWSLVESRIEIIASEG